MSYTKILTTFLFVLFYSSAFATPQNGKSMDSNSIVINHTYSEDVTIAESTAPLTKYSEHSFYHKGDFNVVLLDKKDTVVIPNIKVIRIDFYNNTFGTAELFFHSDLEWATLPITKEYISKIKKSLAPLKAISIRTEEFDMNNLTNVHFSKKNSQLISKYVTKNYNIFFVAKKSIAPKETPLIDRDYFRLVLIIESNHII